MVAVGSGSSGGGGGSSRSGGGSKWWQLVVVVVVVVVVAVMVVVVVKNCYNGEWAKASYLSIGKSKHSVTMPETTLEISGIAISSTW